MTMIDWFRHRMQDLGLWWFHLWVWEKDWIPLDRILIDLGKEDDDEED